MFPVIAYDRWVSARATFPRSRRATKNLLLACGSTCGTMLGRLCATVVCFCTTGAWQCWTTRCCNRTILWTISRRRASKCEHSRPKILSLGVQTRTGMPSRGYRRSPPRVPAPNRCRSAKLPTSSSRRSPPKEGTDCTLTQKL